MVFKEKTGKKESVYWSFAYKNNLVHLLFFVFPFTSWNYLVYLPHSLPMFSTEEICE